MPEPAPRLSVIDDDPIHDPSNPAYELLQKPSVALRGFPMDRRGKVDWVRALGERLIDPWADLSGNTEMVIRGDDIVMTDTRAMPYVRFPHRAHSEWLACENCHEAPFVAREGANAVTMDDIFRGKACGMCHGRVAFSNYVCERCHSIPHAGSPARWW